MLLYIVFNLLYLKFKKKIFSLKLFVKLLKSTLVTLFMKTKLVYNSILNSDTTTTSLLVITILYYNHNVYKIKVFLYKNNHYIMTIVHT